MNNTEEILTAFSIGLLIGDFLLNTGRYRKAIELFKECVVLLNNKVVLMEETFYLGIYIRLICACRNGGDHRQAIEYGDKALAICKDQGKREVEGILWQIHAREYQCLCQYVKAKECLEKALAISIELGKSEREASLCGNLGTVYHYLGNYVTSKEFLEKALAVTIESSNSAEEAVIYDHLGNVYSALGDNVKAKELLEKALAINLESGRKKAQATSCCNLGAMYQCLGEYVKAKECLEKALAISIAIGDKQTEGVYYGSLGIMYVSLGKIVEAKIFLEKALAISTEIGDKLSEGINYGTLGHVHFYLGDYVKAKEFAEIALANSIEIGNRRGEQAGYNALGCVYLSLGDYGNAKEFLEKALAISIEIGDRHGERAAYGNLGNVYHSLGDYLKAEESQKKALAISIEIGDRKVEGVHCGNLGNVYQSLSDYVKAEECFKKALTISTEIGTRDGEGYGKLGNLYQILGDFVKAKEFLEIALTISIQIGDKKKEAEWTGNLGNVFLSLGDYVKAKYFLEKALVISIETGHREGKGTHYGLLGTVYLFLGDYFRAKECLEKAITICIELGNRGKGATHCIHLGSVYFSLGDSSIAEEYYKKGLAVATELGRVEEQCTAHLNLAVMYVSLRRKKKALSCLFAAVDTFEDLRDFLGHNDNYKIHFAEKNNFPYKLLASMLCDRKRVNEALFVVELGRARALADLMSGQYSVNSLETAKKLTLTNIEKIMYNEYSTCSGLYISFSFEKLFFWTIKANKQVLFQELNKDAFAAIHNCYDLSLEECAEALANQSYRHLRGFFDGECEDRSLFTFYETDVDRQTQAEENPASCRLAEEDEQEQGEEPARVSLYKMIISPVVDLLEGSEIIICPERSLYQVPFAALIDEDGRYLSEKFRIRLIPSLTTLKLIQGSPADYHSQTGVLIVGDPDVGRSGISRLPGAQEEAEMIGRLLHVQPLIGREATKQAVLQSMRSVSLIHIAAHGDASRGEIALAPLRPINWIPQKEDFMLTMSDVSQVQLLAKLVVLSCCHSGRGEIRAEGVIGIARAFLGSGARSVLVSLWAVDDMATKEFMREFYDHLSRGESASECLHEAMKWMRGRPQYCAVRQWAPFVLIGDNVTFNFEKLTRDQLSNST